MTARYVSLVASLTLLAAPLARAQDNERARVELIGRVSDAVLRVSVLGTVEVKEKDTVRTVTTGGTGTGFIVVENGRPYVVTNHHVVAPAGGRAWKRPPRIVGSVNDTIGALELELVGADALSDLAVLRFETREHDAVWKKQALTFAKPEGLRIGQSVLVVGYAQGQPGGPSATLGILGGLRRTMGDGKFGGLLQTDAATNSGNSGGPWVNMRGEVIGVHTYGYPLDTRVARVEVPRIKEDGGALKLDGHTPFEALAEVRVVEGMKYARSCESAAPLVRLLIANGKVERPAPGFASVTLPLDEAQVHGLAQGALVVSIDKGSPAAKAAVTDEFFDPLAPNPPPGLAVMDVVTNIRWGADTPRRHVTVTCAGDIQTALAQIPPGSAICLDVWRPSLPRVRLAEAAVKKGWLVGNRDARPEPPEGIDVRDKFHRILAVEYTLPAKPR